MNAETEASGDPPSYPKSGTYADLLTWHLKTWGTRPGGSISVQGEAWGTKQFREAVFKADWFLESNRVLLQNWRGTGSPPSEENAEKVELALFGPPPDFERWRTDLRDARQRSQGQKGKFNKRTPIARRPTLDRLSTPASSPETTTREQLLVDMLFGKFDHERRHALSQLCRLNKVSPEVAEALKRFATESDTIWRRTAAEFIFESNFRTPSWSDWARLFLKDENPEIRRLALHKLSVAASKVEPEIHLALQDPESSLRIKAASILLSRTPVRPSEIASVAVLLTDPHADVREFVATRLLDYVTEDFVSEFNSMSSLLRVVQEVPRLSAKFFALLESGKKLPAPLVIPVLLDMLNSLFSEGAASGDNTKQRRELLSMQRRICLLIAGFGNAALEPALDRLHSKVTNVALGAIYVLGEIGSTASDVIAPLSELARLPMNSVIGQAAVSSLRKLTGKRTLELTGQNPFKEPPSSNVYPWVSREVHVINRRGLDMREATQLSGAASNFISDIVICKEGTDASASECMDVYMLCATQGTVLSISASGPDAYDALDKIETLFAAKFGTE